MNKDKTIDFDQVIDRRNTYCTQWDYVQDRFGEEDLLPFTISDTDFKLPEQVMDSLYSRLNHPIFGYTRWNNGDLQESIHKWYLERFNAELNRDWIIYSPSVMYSVSQLIQMKSSVGDGVIIQTPAYDAFFKTIEGNQRSVIENPLIYNDHYYSIDFEDLELKLSDSNNKILLFCSPHNPTGRLWEEEELKRVIELCRQYGVFIISDEIHMDIVYKDKEHIPLLSLEKDDIALVTSGSKTFNFPGLIFSYLLIPNLHDREEFLYRLKNKDGLSSTSILGMQATMTAYNELSVWLDQLVAYLQGNIDYVIEFFKKHFPEVEVKAPEATYLMWIDVSTLPWDMEEIQRRLIKIGKVAIMDGAIYGHNGGQFLRLNIGCPRSKLEDGLNRLKKSLQ
ncbi:MalY/PatB family protein [Aerococcaceae bacterium WGS1372]